VIFLVMALFLTGALVWLGRRPRAGRGVDSRLAGLAMAAVASAGAFAAVLKGALFLGLLLGGLAAWLWARLSVRPPRPGRVPAALSDQKARAVLGVGADASTEEIQAAYLRLIRTVHPDRGGTSGLAAELNAARDRLLGK
jgi:hypothetical protein